MVGMSDSGNIQVSDTPDQVAEVAADRTAGALSRVLKEADWASFVLAGGTLPPTAYGYLTRKHANSFAWSKVKFLIGDERIVGWSDPQSNWLAAEPMLEAQDIPAGNRLRPYTDDTAEVAAERYERVLRELYMPQSTSPRLDVVWLGMGEDGHTLSLFPNHRHQSQPIRLSFQFMSRLSRPRTESR